MAAEGWRSAPTVASGREGPFAMAELDVGVSDRSMAGESKGAATTGESCWKGDSEDAELGGGHSMEHMASQSGRAASAVASGGQDPAAMAEHAVVDRDGDMARACQGAEAAGACRWQGDSANEERIVDQSMGHMGADSCSARPELSSGGQDTHPLEEQIAVDCVGDMAHASKEAAASGPCSDEDCCAVAEQVDERSVEHLVAGYGRAPSDVASGGQGPSAMAEPGAVDRDGDMAGACEGAEAAGASSTEDCIAGAQLCGRHCFQYLAAEGGGKPQTSEREGAARRYESS